MSAPRRQAASPRLELAAATPDHPIRLGAYDVTALLGKGGMGEVYDAIHSEHGVRVALKTLTHVEPERILRFKTEFRSVAGLSHPNLVPLYELGCQDDLWFFTMERIDGADLLAGIRGARHPAAPPPVSAVRAPATTWATRGDTTVERPRASARARGGATPSLPPSIPRVRDAFAQLVRGVHALHEAGFVHLDLKPTNVLLEPGGRVVILDFGLVQAIKTGPPEPFSPDKVRARRLLGTPAWMAPEQFVGEVGEASD